MSTLYCISCDRKVGSPFQLDHLCQQLREQFMPRQQHWLSSRSPMSVPMHVCVSADTHPHTVCCHLQDMRVVFVDGTVLDTADQNSRAAFLRVNKRLYWWWITSDLHPSCATSCSSKPQIAAGKTLMLNRCYHSSCPSMVMR